MADLKNTFGKKQRLKSRKRIEELFRLGKQMNVSPFRVYYLLGNWEEPLQFGVGVGTRRFKKAVDRNRIKRRIREAYRLEKKLLQDKLNDSGQHMLLFFVFTGTAIPDFKTLSGKIALILNRLSILVDENRSAHT